LVTIASLLVGLWRYARRSHELLRSEVSVEELSTLAAKATPGLILLLLATAVGVVVPTLGALCFLAVSAYLVIPFREIWGAIRGPRPSDGR
jgi:hypothetical protein